MGREALHGDPRSAKRTQEAVPCRPVRQYRFVVTMNCPETREQLELYAMEDLPVAVEAEVADHLTACSDCRAVCDDYRRMIVGLRSAASGAAPRAGFEAATQAMVRAEVRSARRRRWGRRVGFGLSAAAATLLLAVGAGYLSRDEPGGSAGPAAPQVVSAEQWRFGGVVAVPSSPAAGVVVKGPRMYLVHRGEAGHHVAAVSVVTGRLIWESPLESRGYLAADHHRVYCLTRPDRRTLDLIALDATSGRALWRYRGQVSRGFRGPCRPASLPSDRVCWVAGDTVHLLDATSGRAVWTRSFPDEGLLSPARADGGRLYVATRAALRCMETESGDEVWRQPLGAEDTLPSRPLLAIGGGCAYVARPTHGLTSRLVCVGLDARRVRWRRDVPRPRHLLATEDGIYLRGTDVRALDGSTGRPRWTRLAAGCSPLTADEGLLHVVDSGQAGGLLALDRQTGRQAWGIPGIRSCDAFVRAGDLGFVKTLDGIVHAFALRAPQ